MCGEVSKEGEGDEEYVEGGEESQEDVDEFSEHDEIGRDNDGEEGVRSTVNCVNGEAEDDDVNSDMAQSDIIISPLNSDEEVEVAPQLKCVTKQSKFQMFELGNPQVVVS